MSNFQPYPTEDNNKSMGPTPFSSMTNEDQRCVSFLMTLKNRSVTPEPLDDSTEENDHDQETDNGSSRSRTPPLKAEYNGGLSEDYDAHEDISGALEVIVSESSLVKMSDRDLVPDALFVAMAQMKPCEFEEEDRVGCYKARELGFVGMSCKHCGGQPGFGKYFPATVRSLAQTTTSQTILKHVGAKCKKCPDPIRKAVQSLQLKDNEQLAQGERPRYGSRKIFFQRVWGRLHNQPIPDIPDSVKRASQGRAKIAVPQRKLHHNLMMPQAQTSQTSSDSEESSEELAHYNAPPIEQQADLARSMKRRIEGERAYHSEFQGELKRQRMLQQFYYD